MHSLAIQCIPASSFFFQRLPTIFFSFSFSSSPSSLHILYLFNFCSFFSSTKAFAFSLISSQSDFHFLLQSQLFSQTLSSPSMAPKSRKISNVLSTDVFYLTRWNGVVRLTATPHLTYRSQQHNLEGARTGSVSFSHFSHF